MPPLPPPVQIVRTNGLARAALVTGLLGCVSVVGLILGIIALVQIRRSGERGRGLAIGGMVASLVWLVVLALGVTNVISGADGEKSSGSAFQLYPKTGQCFVFPGGKPSVDTTITSCDRPHDGEMIVTFNLPEGPWPGQSEIDRLGGEGCDERLIAKYRMQSPVENAELWIFFPHRLSWKFGDRKIHCTLIAVAGTKLTAPIGPGDPRSRRWDELQKGDCFSHPKDKQTQVVTLTDCAKPHSAQVTRTFVLPQGKYPGDRAVRKKADTGCPEMSTKNGGPSGLDDWHVLPNQESWPTGDRTVICYVTAAKGDLKKSVLPK